LRANHRVYCAVAAIMAAHSAVSYAAAPADAEVAPEDNLGLSEVTVTAQRRTENIQDVPITVQALTGETLKQLNVTTFDDYIKYLPNVTSQGGGPGQQNIYMRGLAAAVGAIQGAGVVGGFPNVAIYLDDQSGQLPARNLDIYAADMERIEVLEGPQGTLFGAGAQAGVVRYITNKPNLTKVSGNVEASTGVTAGGGPNNSASAVLKRSDLAVLL